MMKTDEDDGTRLNYAFVTAKILVIIAVEFVRKITNYICVKYHIVYSI